MNSNKLLPTHLSLTEYAAKKQRSRQTIYRHIKNGNIVPDQVGMIPKPMIDWEKYKDLDLPESFQDIAKRKKETE